MPADPPTDPLRVALAAIADPAGGGNIVATGRVESVEMRDGLVQVALRVAPAERAGAAALVREVEAVLRARPEVRNATVVLTSHREAPAAAPGPAARPKLLASVDRVVAVASGKGGVGKSTVAVNLALGLARHGLRVGLLDADIHGPSLSRMLGVGDGQPAVRGDRMVPPVAWGISCMSMGMLVPEGRAMIWRGPMVMGALEQLMGQVDWPPLDVMVVDMPPGTGDAQLTMAQRVALAGAVIVSTPQDIALIDARRGVSMFRDTGVPILGVVENMSFFQCPHCGQESHVFGHGGARLEAEKLGVPFLGAVPLLLDVREAGDAGTPVMARAPDGEAGRAFAAIAELVAASIR